MKVVVAEVGNMPAIATYARLNARAGASALCDLMASIDTIDMGQIILDWQGDGITPVMTIKAAKTYPGWNGKWLHMDPWHISIDDAFSKDNMDNGGLRQIAYEIQQLFQREEELAAAKGII